MTGIEVEEPDVPLKVALAQNTMHKVKLQVGWKITLQS
jgi:hypothetical protein